ncbi:MAG: P1 family peptidase [Elusimicrobia bacterium]|nr:P1 family peptidase [Elusimicrobiota bacterium]
MSKNMRPRVKDLNIKIGTLPCGKFNAITDVKGVRVGHTTLIKGEGPLIQGKGPVRTGITAIIPCEDNIFQKKLVGAVHIINGFGKSVGLFQIQEVGVIESPILLTGTLNVWRVADTLIDYLSKENTGIFSFNPIVAECNDALLNDALGRHAGKEHVLKAIETAQGGEVEEGNVGAGVGMSSFGFKSGIGTSSRIISTLSGEYTIGVLVLMNTGKEGELKINGVPVGLKLQKKETGQKSFDDEKGGSIIIVVATDAPLSSRQLTRVAKRATFGLSRTGATASNSSGDIVIAFSTANRIPHTSEKNVLNTIEIHEPIITELFEGVIDATEEAIINSVLKADTLTGINGKVFKGIPIDEVVKIMSFANI